jgi:hypothetical protein
LLSFLFTVVTYLSELNAFFYIQTFLVAHLRYAYAINLGDCMVKFIFLHVQLSLLYESWINIGVMVVKYEIRDCNPGPVFFQSQDPGLNMFILQQFQTTAIQNAAAVHLGSVDNSVCKTAASLSVSKQLMVNILMMLSLMNGAYQRLARCFIPVFFDRRRPKALLVNSTITQRRP